MAKITAVIDIGSGSIRMSLFEKTSRFAFNIIKEFKFPVRLSKGTYANNFMLQEDIMLDAISCISSFVSIAKSYKAHKVLAIATSAVRNAPNKKEFKKRIKKSCGIDIKIIDGENEARLGAIGVINLLPLKNGITIDTGGGSSEISFIENSKIVQSISVDLGSMSIKEKFFDNNNIDLAKNHIQKTIQDISNTHNSSDIVLIGGSAKELSKLLMDKSYPIPLLHGYKYSLDKLKSLKKSMNDMDKIELLNIGIDKNRLDTIKPATLVIYEIIKKLIINNKEKHITISSVGVREGVFLNDMLKKHNYRLPSNYNVGIRAIKDKFISNDKELLYVKNIAYECFNIFKNKHNLDDKYKKYLYYALVLLQSNSFIDIRKKQQQSNHIITNKRIFALSHKEKALLIVIIKYANKKSFQKKHIESFKDLIDFDVAYWLRLIFTIAINLAIDMSKKISLSLNIEKTPNVLEIKSNKNCILEKQSMDNLYLDDIINISWIIE